MRNIFKRHLAKLLSAVVIAGFAVGVSACGSNDASSSPISVITREAGSGTRSAFIELFEVQDKEKVDHTTDKASVNNSTAVMLTSVASDPNAIGYISLGALNDTVKVMTIDGKTPNVENVKSGDYEVSRPFSVVTKEDALTETDTEFLNFLNSTDAAEVTNHAGYIAIDANDSYIPTAGVSGKITIGGSSSVSPLMEKLIEKFKELNTNITVELQTSDSSTGINGVTNGIFDIAMTSRELKSSETEKGLKETRIATDGLAVIVNNDNAISNLTKEQVKSIYTGEVTSWGDIK